MKIQTKSCDILQNMKCPARDAGGCRERGGARKPDGLVRGGRRAGAARGSDVNY